MSRQSKARLNPCLPCLLLGNPSVLPPPRDVAALGLLLELEHEMPDGQVVRHSWEKQDAPLLFWQEEQQALYGFSRGGIGPKRNPRKRGFPKGAADAYTRWNAGRRPSEVYDVDVPAIEMRKAGKGVSILYRSDKFGPLTNYIHPFEKGVEVDLSPGRPPAVFYIRGGNLRLTPRGLEG